MGDRAENGECSTAARYELGVELGRGTFGDVYAARCLATGKPVAVKSVDKRYLRNATSQAALLREVAILRQLNHPNVLSLLDAYEDEDAVYLVTELCGRGELLEHVRSRGGLPEHEAAAFAQQLASGLRYLHDNAILHRDIKLANLLLTDAGLLKIADFGLAATLEGADSERMTMCGTPNYLAPEVAAGRRYGLSADVWSLGVALFTMLTGHPPFQGARVADTLANVREGRYSHALPEAVGPVARELLAWLLRADPAQRPTLPQVLSHPFLSPTHHPAQEVPLDASPYSPAEAASEEGPCEHGTRPGGSSQSDGDHATGGDDSVEHRGVVHAEGSRAMRLLGIQVEHTPPSAGTASHQADGVGKGECGPPSTGHILGEGDKSQAARCMPHISSPQRENGSGVEVDDECQLDARRRSVDAPAQVGAPSHPSPEEMCTTRRKVLSPLTHIIPQLVACPTPALGELRGDQAPASNSGQSACLLSDVKCEAAHVRVSSSFGKENQTPRTQSSAGDPSWLLDCPSPLSVPNAAKQLRSSLAASSHSCGSSGGNSGSGEREQGEAPSMTSDTPSPLSDLSMKQPPLEDKVLGLGCSQELRRCASELCRSSMTVTGAVSCATAPPNDARVREHVVEAPSTEAAPAAMMPPTARLSACCHSTGFGHLAVLAGGEVEVVHNAHGLRVVVSADGKVVTLERSGRPARVRANPHPHNPSNFCCFTALLHDVLFTLTVFMSVLASGVPLSACAARAASFLPVGS
jgi:serine/threonine protein kinase